MKLRFGLFFVLAILFFGGVSAKYLCGDVTTSENVNPAWYTVDIFYTLDSTMHTSCEVSPDGNRYCCPLTDVVEDWEPDQVYGARIIDTESGYVASPVYLTTTTAPYDIFPTLDLKKVIKVYKPSEFLQISNDSSVFFNVSFLDEYSQVKFDGSPVPLEDGIYLGVRNGSFGENDFVITASNEEDTFVEHVPVLILESVNFSRDFECRRCRKNKVPQDKNVTVHLSLALSENVSGLKIYEYVPTSWDLIDLGGAEFEYADGDYNRLYWVVNGDKFNVTYEVHSPDDGREYYFYSFLEKEEVDNESYYTYKYIKPKPKPPRRRGGGGFWRRKIVSREDVLGNLSRVDKNHAIVLENKSLRLAIYAKNFTDEGKASLILSNFTGKIHNRSLKFLEGYELNTNLGKNIDRISFELKLNKKDLKKKGFGSFKLYGKTKEGRFVPLTGRAIVEGDDIKYVLENGEYIRDIFVFGIKDKLTFWDRVVQWFWKVFKFKTGFIS